jgi:hypothetical protein
MLAQLTLSSIFLKEYDENSQTRLPMFQFVPPCSLAGIRTRDPLFYLPVRHDAAPSFHSMSGLCSRGALNPQLKDCRGREDGQPLRSFFRAEENTKIEAIHFLSLCLSEFVREKS